MENMQKNSAWMGVVKTMLWFCAFAILGYFTLGQFFKGKSQGEPQDRAPANSSGDDSSLVGKYNPRVRELSRDYQAITFGDLGKFYYYAPDPWEKPDPELLKGNKIPDKVKALSGKKVALTGFMMPIDQDADGSKEFVLNGSYDMCGFGGPVAINQWVMVNYTGNGRVPYTHLPMTIFGELEVGEDYRDGRLFSIYRMKVKAASTPQVLVE
jgi:hypothetical protein